jgi:hypothetical protein
MKKLILIFLCLPILGLANNTYVFPKVRKSNKDNVQILQIETNDKTTIISCRFIPKKEGWVRAQSPDSKFSFIIKADKKSYNLQQVKGLGIAPERTEFELGDTINFDLYFKALPPSVKVINIVERVKKSDAWSFYGVQLAESNLVANYLTIFSQKKDFSQYFKNNKKDLNPIEGFWRLNLKMLIELSNGKKKRIDMLKDIDTIAIVKENNTYMFYTLDGFLINIGALQLPLEPESFKMVFLMGGHRFETKKFKVQKKFEKEWKVPDFHKMLILGKNYDEKSKVVVQSKWRAAGRK